MSLKSQIMSRLAWCITHKNVRDFKRQINQITSRILSKEHNVDIFYRVDDPYSYLLIQLMDDFCKRHQLSLKIHVVNSLDEQMYPDYEALEAWSLEDCRTMAKIYGLDFPVVSSIPPKNSLMAMQKILLALKNDPDAFIQCAKKLGDQAFSGALALPKAYLTALESKQLIDADKMLRSKGHYLTGTLYYQGEWYWGVERLGYLERRLGGDQRYDLLREMPVINNDSYVHVTLYLSLRSPYSYIALKRCAALVDENKIKLKIKPVLPMVMRGMKVPSSKKFYILHDAKREADFHDIPFGRICDPLGKAIEYCYALFEWAASQGKEVMLFESVATGVWSEGLNGVEMKDLRVMVERANLDWNEAKVFLTDESMARKSWLNWTQANREEINAEGLWGVPVIDVNNEFYWGQDKLGVALSAEEQCNVRAN
jgi:2-hydroxychromene-2-carboxylate isomerase